MSNKAKNDDGESPLDFGDVADYEGLISDDDEDYEPDEESEEDDDDDNDYDDEAEDAES